MDFLSNPFFIGLMLGLFAAAVVAVNSWNASRSLKREVRRLQEHLHTQLTINARGNHDLTSEVDRLKAENENLRISLAALQNKPDRTELRTLYVYDKAVRLMYQKVPGFAPAWESVLEEAETEMQQINSGMLAWVRRAIRPAPAGKPRAPEDPRDDEP